MRRQHLISLVIILVLLSACTPIANEASTPTAPSAVDTAETPIIINESVLLELPTPIPGTVALDFSEKPCSASWSNNGEYLPCPGNLDAITSGYADRFGEIVIDGNITIQQPGLLTIPSQPDSKFQAIFGKYPPFTVMDGDRFQAVLACEHGYPACDADAALEYYNASGQIEKVPGADWQVTANGEGIYIYADADLSALARRTVQFSLAVRDNGNPTAAHIAWIMPHIARLGGAATDAIPPHQLQITQIETVQISGVVDMQSAPPYLYDDHPAGSPAAVVLFDVNSDMWYTTETSSESAAFTIEVLPGEYHVLAYSYGVGDIPYVEGAYTGINPSCGKAMGVLQILADKPVQDVIINDWNWSCEGTAQRLAKPEEVPLP